MEVQTTQNENKVETRIIEYEELEHKFKMMISDPQTLKNGYTILKEFEAYNKFHLNLLNIILSHNSSNDLRKLVSCSLKIFIKNNWNNEAYISYTEKLVRNHS